MKPIHAVPRALIAMLRALCVLIFVSAAVSARADTANILFQRGNVYYENGEFNKAVEEYEHALDGGFESGPLYYNLAGAYFKSGKLGRAVLNYERAMRLLPLDTDLSANYAFVRSKVRGKVVPERSLWNWRPLEVYAGAFTKTGIVWVTSILYIMVVLVAVLAIIRPEARRYAVAVSAALILLILLNGSVIWYKAGGMGKEAVVVVPEVDAFFGPFNSGTKFFTIYEGMPCKVLKYKDDWCRIKRPDGKAGWVRKDTVEEI